MLLVSIIYSFFLWSSSSVWLVVDGQSVEGQPDDETITVLKRQLIETVLASHGIKNDTFDALNLCLDKLSKELQLRDELIREMKIKMDKIWVTNKPQRLSAKVFVNGTVKIINRLIPQNVIITKPVSNPTGDYNDLERRLNWTSKEVNRIAYAIDYQVIRKDKPRQVINGNIHFLNPITAETITIETIKPTTLINGISLNDLKYNVLRHMGNQSVTGKWTFSSRILVNSLKVKGLLSGRNMSNLLLTNSPYEQVITGKLTIGQSKFRSLTFDSVNKIKKDELVFNKHYSIPTITGSKRFTQPVSAVNINLTGKLNGHNWNEMVKKSININSPTVQIPTSLRFTTVPTINTLHARTVNNIRIDNLKSGLTADELIELSSSKTFRVLTAAKVTLRGKLNGLSVPDDLVTLRSLQNISSSITFNGRVKFNSTLRVGTINGVDIVRDTVFRISDKPQIIHGRKIFERNVNVRKLTSKASKLRHINLDALDPLEKDGAQFSRRSNVVYDDKLTINGNLQVKTINGIKIDQLIGSLFSRSRDQAISWPIKFNGNLSIGSVTTDKINGLRVDKDLVKSNQKGEQVITGRKVFNSVSLGTGNGLIMKGYTLNGFELPQHDIIMNDPLRKKDCFGKKSFSSVTVVGNIIAEKVNGLNLERDVMLTDRPQNITGLLTFTSDVTSYQLSFPSGLKVDKINNQPMNEILDNLVLYDSQSVTLENKDFRGGLIADEIDLKGTMNGYDLNQILSSAVNLDKPQAIYSPLIFKDEVTFDNPIDARSINGYDLQKKFSTIIAGDNIKITGNVKINGDLITGRLNSEPPEKLKEYIFQSRIDNQFDRPVIFNSTVTIDHLTVSRSATLDGIRPDDLLPLDKPIQLTEPMIIRGNAYIDNHLIVRSGIINNCSLAEMTRVTGHQDKSKDLIFSQPINFNQVNILGNLRLINSKLNGVDVDQLRNQVLIVADKHQTFNSTFTFTNDVYVDELFVSGPINGVDLASIYADSVRKSGGHQKISGHKTFKSLKVNNGDLTFKNDVQLRGTINGVNLNKLNDNLIKPGTYNIVRGVKIFTSNEPIILENIESPMLGGVNLSELVLVSTSESIPTDTIFTKPIEINNLETRHHQGRQLVNKQNTIQFMNPVNVQQLKVKRINGIPVENFVSTLRDTQLNGSYTINGLYIHGNLIMNENSTINGINLSEIKNQSIDLRTANYIPGVTVLAGGVNFEKGINLIDDPINGPGASVRLTKSLRNATNWLEMDLQQLENELKNQTMLLARYTASIDPDNLKFDYFDVIDYFNDFDIETNRIDKIALSKDYHSNTLEPFTRTIYLQYTNQSDNCQRKTSTFEIESNGKHQLKDGLINADGKYFPLVTFPNGNNSISISGQTNLTECQIDPDDQESYISSVTIDYSVNGTQSPQSYKFAGNFSFSDINYFLDGNNQIILITLRSMKIGLPSLVHIYRCAPKTGNPPGCHLIGQLSESNVISMETINSLRLDSQFLALMVKPIDCSKENSTIIIYKWDSGKFTRIESISTPNPLAMKFIEIPQRQQINLIVGNNADTGICAHDKSIAASSLINIYRVKNPQSSVSIELIQQIDLNVIAISSFKVNQKVYLVLASSDDTTSIYEYETKSNQFKSLDQHYTTKGVADVNCFWISPNQLFMITTTTDHHKAIIYQAYLTGFTN